MKRKPIWIDYTTTIALKRKTANKIKEYISLYPYGRTINNVMEDLKLARGTVKTYLTAMVYAKEIVQVDYNQNTKVFFKKKYDKM